MMNQNSKNYHFNFFGLFLILTLIIPLNLFSQTWQQLGEGCGGQILTMYADPSNPSSLYLGSDVAGIWRSDDGGTSYKYITRDWKCESAQAVFKHPIDNKLYVGCSSGIFATENDGDSWSQLLSASFVSNLYVYQSGGSDIIYATTGKTRIEESGQQLMGDNKIWRYNYQSNGVWQSFKISTPTTSNTYSLNVNPSNPSEIWVTTNNGVFVSFNGGSTWVNKTSNMPSGNITSMVSNPSNFAEKIVTNYTEGVYKRNPSTGNWTNITTNIVDYNKFSAVVISPTATGAWGQQLFLAHADGHLNRGLWYTSNGGISWGVAGFIETAEMGWNFGSKIACNPRSISFNSLGHLYMGKPGNMFKSINPQDGDLSVWTQIYTMDTGGGVYKNRGMVNTVSRDIVADPANPSEMWIAEGDRLLWKSNDAGESFSKVENFTLNTDINLQHGYFVVFNPADPNIMLAGLAEASPGGSITSALFKSNNGGDSWTQIYTWEGTELVKLAYNKTGTEIYLGLRGTNGGVYKSNTGGSSWQYVAWGTNNVYDVNTHPTDNNLMFVGIGDPGPPTRGLHRGVRNGNNWQFTRVLNAGLNWDIKYDPFDAAIIYVAMGLSGTYKSIDNGLTWNLILPAAGTTGTGCRAIAVDKATGDLYVASDGDELGILQGGEKAYLKKSIDKGVTWTDLTQDFPNVPIWNMNYINDSNNSSLVVNTKGLGCWKLKFSSCVAPLNLATSEISENSAKLNWDLVAGVTGYIINYKKDSDSIWTALGVAGGDVSNQVVTGLAANTMYQWKIKTNCTSAGFSSSIGFTTLVNADCPIVLGLATDQITTTSARIKWTAQPSFNGYTIRYRKLGETNWTEFIIQNPNLTKKVYPGLIPNTTYQWSIKVNCSGTSNYGNIIEFTTLQMLGISVTSETETEAITFSEKSNITEQPDIYPNPTSNGIFAIELKNNSDATATIEVYDLTGKLIQSMKTQNTRVEISTENMPAGFYFVKTTQGSLIYNEKLLVR